MDTLRLPPSYGSPRSAVVALALALGKLPRVGTADLVRRSYSQDSVDPVVAGVLAHAWEWGTGRTCPGWGYLQDGGYADGWLLFFAKAIAAASGFSEPCIRQHYPAIGSTIASCSGAVPPALGNGWRTARDPGSLERLIRSRLVLGSAGSSHSMLRWRLYRLALAQARAEPTDIEAVHRLNPHLRGRRAPIIRTPAGTYLEVGRVLSHSLAPESPHLASFSRRGMEITGAWSLTAGRKLFLSGPTEKEALVRWIESGNSEIRAEWFLRETFWSPNRGDAKRLSGWENGCPRAGWSRQDLPGIAISALHWAG